ncbi:MAG TPA: hypothetical protein VH062_03345 [Polyangiaceae bacterium]|nr:hypothetical protein [Polyangiaceae bacterium]
MFALLGAIGVTSLAGCEREVVVEHPHGCRDAVWVRGHHDRYGYWRHGHWVCGPRRHVVVVGVVR